MSSNILTSVADGVRIIKFNRPNKKNAINNEMYAELTTMLNEDALNDSIVVTILTGVGEYFSSGNELSLVQFGTNPDIEKLLNDRLAVVKNFFTAVINYPKLLIAVVNGPSIGVAVTTLALCDIVYASDRATFSTPFSRLGLCPEGTSSYSFPRIMGRSKASEMLFLGKKMTAQEAYNFGFVSKVIPHKEFDVVINQLRKYGQLSVNYIKNTKRLINMNLKDTLHKVNEAECEELWKCFNSSELYEAMAKFYSRKSKL